MCIEVVPQKSEEPLGSTSRSIVGRDDDAHQRLPVLQCRLFVKPFFHLILVVFHPFGSRFFRLHSLFHINHNFVHIVECPAEVV